MFKFRTKQLLLLLVMTWFLYASALGQTTEFNQISNEIQFTRSITDKLATELVINGDYSETPQESRIMQTNIQRGAVFFGHYQYSPRWKLSSFIAYYNNKDVPDLGQYNAKEWRFGLQGIYYIKKVGYTLSTRGRAELRYLQNEEGIYEDIFRYRQMIKLIQPLNAKVLRQGVFYFITSEEVILRSTAKATGMAHFDRNRLQIGGGYIINDNLQVELSYLNEFVPRDSGDQLYHIAGVSLTINNFLPNLKKKLGQVNLIPQPDE
jgi:hypothetical protein